MPSDLIWPILCVASVGVNLHLLRPRLATLRGKTPPMYMKDKMCAVLEEGEAKGCIQSTERKLVENVLDFKDKTAEDIMIHRRDVTMVSLDESSESILGKIREKGLSRFPVYDHNADDVVGILATRKFLLNHVTGQKKSLRELIYPAYFVPKTVGSEALLRDMQSRKTHISVVVDEYGGVDGIVTLEDLLEEIVGNIYDEFDPLAQQQIIPISTNLWMVAGSADLKEVTETLGLDIPIEELDCGTVGGLVFDQLDIIPQDGVLPQVDAFGLHIKVDSMIGRRIQWVLLSTLVTSDALSTSSTSSKE